MQPPFVELSNSILWLEHQLKERKTDLQELRERCNHQWGEPVYDPLVSYGNNFVSSVILGKENTAVPNSSNLHTEYKARWRRDCNTCGSTEYTQNYKVNKIPDFSPVVDLKVSHFT